MTLPMWFAYLLRGDVREGVAPEELEAQHEFVAWWMLWGRIDYPQVWHWDAGHADIAMQLVPLGPDLLCPRLLRRLHSSRPDLQQAFPLKDNEGLAEFFAWYRVYGPSELAAAPELPSTCMAMTECSSRHPFWSAGGCQVPRIVVAPAPRLQNLLSVGPGDSRRTLQFISDRYQKYGQSLVPPPTIPPASLRAGRVRKRQSGGVNLVGFVRGQSGLGEDVRMASAALEAVRIPHVLVDVPIASAIPQDDSSLTHLLTDRPLYGITIYCMSAFDMATLYLARGPGFFSGQYRIGYWPWELPRFPALWHQAYMLIDEIWTGSKFSARAYSPYCSQPVKRLPCPVRLAQVQPVPRHDLGLHDEDAFVFVYPFDVNSHIARKNPLGLVRAFRQAFPPPERRVALLLRVNGDPEGRPGWFEVATESSTDSRIAILAGTFDRPKALGVIAACDCLVSPHRAEGFGRNIAEAILLGIPVLATAFSVCMDFLAPEEGIPFANAAVWDRDYPFAEGLQWAEPSVDEMARRMREVRHARRTDRAGMERRLSLRGAQIAEMYSPTKTGQAFNRRLRMIERQMLLNGR